MYRQKKRSANYFYSLADIEKQKLFKLQSPSLKTVISLPFLALWRVTSAMLVNILCNGILSSLVQYLDMIYLS